MNTLSTSLYVEAQIDVQKCKAADLFKDDPPSSLCMQLLDVKLDGRSLTLRNLYYF